MFDKAVFLRENETARLGENASVEERKANRVELAVKFRVFQLTYWIVELDESLQRGSSFSRIWESDDEYFIRRFPGIFQSHTPGAASESLLDLTSNANTVHPNSANINGATQTANNVPNATKGDCINRETMKLVIGLSVAAVVFLVGVGIGLYYCRWADSIQGIPKEGGKCSSSNCIDDVASGSESDSDTSSDSGTETQNSNTNLSKAGPGMVYA